MTEKTLRERAEFLATHVPPTLNQTAAVQFAGETIGLLLDRIEVLEARLDDRNKSPLDR